MELTEADYLHTPTGTRQRDLTVGVVYDAGYLATRYATIPEKMRALAEHRVQVLNAFRRPPGRLLDYGCGVGAVVEAARRAGWEAVGCDVVPGAMTPGEATGRGPWDAVTFFDSLEHVPDPSAVVRGLDAEWVVVSVPWCHHPERWEWFGPWKHRRPLEHLHHWNRDTLAALFADLGYREVATGCVEDDFRPNPEQGEPNILTAIYRRHDA